MACGAKLPAEETRPWQKQFTQMNQANGQRFLRMLTLEYELTIINYRHERSGHSPSPTRDSQVVVHKHLMEE
jgi:hypothetical protein